MSHDLVRHRRLNSDAKILLIHIQGLPDDKARRPLSDIAEELGIKGRAYQKAKEQLLECGYFHEWRWQSQRGRWSTDQLCSNVCLSGEEADQLREGTPPSDPVPAVGATGGRTAGASPPEAEDGEKTTAHHPPKAPDPEPAPEPDPEPEPEPARGGEVVQAERVLLSLRHTHRELLLGVREARGLADAAAEWLRRGVSAADLRHALTSGLPRTGVRSAAGFVRHRLLHKLPGLPEPEPAATATATAAPTGPPALVVCEGPGPDHVFRPLGDETHCGACRLGRASSAQRPVPRAVDWRTLVEEVGAHA
ncbi:hypothetical protein [Streptomyces sp. NPDC000410]|uniref:hypothetical protein n=1 Tax=Streptomyces sp. NPDC000410 TaxID=3154254 RepID=UPI00332F5771